jgi:quinol monooxygenase YgiN
MRTHLFSGVICAIAILALGSTQSVQAQSSAVYICAYIDLVPNAVSSAEVLLKRYRNSSRTQPGNLQIEVLHEIARPSRFAILEAWADEVALESHERAASTLRFRDRLEVLQRAPSDKRVVRGVYLGRPETENHVGAIYVLTHVDITPDHLDDGLQLLKDMTVETAKDYGNISYEVLQQADPANHFTVVEVWTNKKALDAHVQAAHTREFRKRVLPLQGGLYDERMYDKVD